MNGCFYYNDKNKDEIKVGDYVRTKQGKIIQISRVDKQQHYTYIYGDNGFYHIPLNDIVKHSSNIIDLIEVGDYVNGMEVETVYGYDEDGNDKDELGICETDEDYAYYKYLEDINIYSIVTKEQFQSVEFRLEE